MTWHVYPVDDDHTHITGQDMCACAPSVQHMNNGDLIIIHTSWRRRAESLTTPELDVEDFSLN